MILRGLFGNKKDGFYIDVGAHHPFYYSNTYHFYLKGWHGLNIDALPGSMKIFDKIRSRDINVERCLSDKDDDNVDFYCFTKPAINTFDKNYADELVKKGETLLDSVALKTKKLSSILREYQLADRTIDFLSIDVEGIDAVILKSLDYSKIRPKAIVFEDHNIDFKNIYESDIVKFLNNHGYKVVAKTGPSIIVVDERHTF